MRRMDPKALPREAGVKRKINGIPVSTFSPFSDFDASFTAYQALYATAKVFIGGLSATTTENQLRAHFSAFGEVNAILFNSAVVFF